MEYSIYDIAQRAGVSKSTVSRVLNKGSVSERSRAAVMRVLAETGYHPNQSARTLRGAQSYVIGICAATAGAFLSPSATTRLAGIIGTLYENGYSVLFVNEAQKPRGDVTPFSFLEQHMVDGLIFMQDIERPALRRAATEHREIVYTGERILPDKGLRIYMGNYDYSQVLYRHLMERGHRRVLTLMMRLRRQIGRKRRYEAYADTCAEYGTAPEPESFVTYESSQGGEAALESVYTLFVQGGYTAVFFDDLLFANSVQAYFMQKGMRPGKDFSFVAIERGAQKLLQTGGITSVVLPDYEYGKTAAQMLLRALEDPKLDYLDVQLPFQLQDRHSVAWLPPAEQKE